MHRHYIFNFPWVPYNPYHPPFDEKENRRYFIIYSIFREFRTILIIHPSMRKKIDVDSLYIQFSVKCVKTVKTTLWWESKSMYFYYIFSFWWDHIRSWAIFPSGCVFYGFHGFHVIVYASLICNSLVKCSISHNCMSNTTASTNEKDTFFDYNVLKHTTV